MYIDTHCHFDVDDFAADRQAVAGRARAAGVEAIVVPGYLASLWPHLLRVCDSITTPRLFAAPGLHPCYVEQHQDADLVALDALLQQRSDCVAVGEIGLDYFLPELKAPEQKARQQFLFREQLHLAERHGKPVILHVRKAHHDVLAMLKAERFSRGGIVHAWSGGIEEARAYQRLGFRLGIGGPVTYDQAKRLRSVVEQMPLSALVLETDAPDMIPQPHREVQPAGGRSRNSPEFLPAVAEAVAALKQMPLANMLPVLRANSVAALQLPLPDPS